MKVYLSGGRAAAAREHIVYVSPAKHMQDLENDSEMPSDWVSETNEPLTFPITFSFGEAEVPSNMGRYLLKYGLASKTRLIIPDGVKAA